MKTLRFRLVQMAALCLLFWLPDMTSAGTSFYIGFGSGHRHSRRSYHHDRGRRQHRSNRHHRNFKHVGRNRHHRSFHIGRNRSRRSRNYRSYGNTIVFGSGFYYRTEPYYVVTRTSPRVIERRVIVVQPDRCDASTELLLDRLAMGNKWQRLDAIEQLAELSFNDRVRKALENVLLSDPDPQLRKEVAHIFGVVRNINALPALEKARVEDPDEDVRKEADYAIEKIEAN